MESLLWDQVHTHIFVDLESHLTVHLVLLKDEDCLRSALESIMSMFTVALKSCG